MKIEDFKIGECFYGLAGFKWRCTDKGSRTITAIMIDPEKGEEWYIGPPYSVNEEVFDEKDMVNCIVEGPAAFNEMIKSRVESLDKSAHPHFLHEDVMKMMKAKGSNNKYKYPRKKILKYDRVGLGGEIYHPYGAYKKDHVWYINLFELFSREYTEMNEDDFIKLAISKEEDLVKRKENYKK